MSTEVEAKEYQFEPILPWQTEPWRRLQQQHVEACLPHALMVCGPAGIGKARLCMQLVASLVCEALQEGAACQQCKQCRLLAAGTHSDFQYIEPEKPGAALKVDVIRQLVHFFSQSSLQGGRKIALLMPAEDMSISAANALLKTLEEPPGNALLILIAHASGRILPTIRSRCQVLDLALPTRSESVAWLEQEADTSSQGLDHKDLVQLLNLAGGAPLRALQMFESNAHEVGRSMQEQLGAVLKGTVAISEIAEVWADERAQARMEWLQNWLSRIIRHQALNFAEPEERMFDYLARKASPESLFDLLDCLRQQYALLIGSSNPNPALLFEVVLMRWQGLLR